MCKYLKARVYCDMYDKLIEVKLGEEHREIYNPHKERMVKQTRTIVGNLCTNCSIGKVQGRG